MFTKEEIWNSIQNEIRIIKHLFTKVPEGQMDYRPTEKQRSTLELLQYLAITTPVNMKAIVSGDQSPFMESASKAAEVTVENFLEKITQGEEEAKTLFSELTDEDFAKEVDFFGMKFSKSSAILEMLLKGLVAYKTQLFLYAKASGNYGISTSDLWRGVDSQTSVH